MSVSLTINEIDDATAAWLKAEAERKGVSIESVAVELIQKGAARTPEPLIQAVYHDLDSLAGTWTEEQATEFLKAVEYFELIDEHLWR